MTLLSEIYDVTLKRNNRNASINGYVRPTVGEYFVTHKDFKEVNRLVLIEPYFFSTYRCTLTNAGRTVLFDDYFPSCHATTPLEYPIYSLNCNLYFNITSGGARISQSISLLEYNDSDTVVSTHTVSIHNGVPMHRLVINLDENKLTTIYGNGTTIINSGFTPVDSQNRFVFRWNCWAGADQSITLSPTNDSSYISYVPEHCRELLRLVSYSN